ncbi:hypothetical protein BDU57DRAFT_528130 [Ampelomyces quisqualis]|uniref:Uncharacterized protein n=1 Tax=Ampelomyces quisqualis TaxID=50730 RepID=A0A6A5QP74_AMPQU|nr:hypothetical protein BDU57DRAFT_528130 [Ampelomyces quisqualis]
MDDKTTPTTQDLRPPFHKPRPIPPPSSTSASQACLDSIGQQPVLDTATSIPLNAIDSLPTITGRGNNVVLAKDEIGRFLNQDLNLSRLNRIHGYLWMAGRPMRARPLHRYKMMSFDVLCTQQMDLHLLHFNSKLMIKTLPEWILCANFWKDHLCGDVELHKSACGFLLSYVWLLTTPLDLKIAHDLSLVPSFITWQWWKDLVADFLDVGKGNVDINTLAQVNKRYQFGDLRLGRINSIYRIRYFHTHFVRGYLYGYNRYVVFFERNFSWILIVFVFFSLVLSAMQVGIGLRELEDNHAFLRASYVFVVFSMVSVVAVLAIVCFIFIVIFLVNMVLAISHAAREQRERKKLAKKKSLRGKEA